MKNRIIRAFGVTALSTSLLACVGVEDAETEDETIIDAEDVGASEEGLTAKAIIPRLVPLLVTLHQHDKRKGDFRSVVVDEPILGETKGCYAGLGFGHVTSSVTVQRGPDYDQWVADHGGATPYVYLYEHNHYGGRRVVLEPGIYPRLSEIGFADLASSVRIIGSTAAPADLRPAPQEIGPSSAIPVILEGYTNAFDIHCGPSRPVGYKLTLVGSNSDFDESFGSAFNDKLSRIDVIPSTGFDPNAIFGLYVDRVYQGHFEYFRYDIKRMANLADWGFNDKITAIDVRR